MQPDQFSQVTSDPLVTSDLLELRCFDDEPWVIRTDTCAHNLLCHYQQASGKLMVPPVKQEPPWMSEFTVMETGSAVEVEA